MENTEIFAALALVVSLGSLLVSIKSYNNSKAAQSTANKQAQENEKEQLLRLLSDNKALLTRTKTELTSLQADYNSERNVVKTLMNSHEKLFTTFLPTIETSIQNIDSYWKSIHEWPGEISYKDIIKLKAECHDDLNSSETGCQQAIKCITEFKEKLQLAKEYQDGATRDNA